MTLKQIENTMAFILEYQAKFASNFARAEKRFGLAEKRLDRLEELARLTIRTADERLKRLEATTAVLQDTMIDLTRSQKSVLDALRRQSGNGRKRSS